MKEGTRMLGQVMQYGTVVIWLALVILFLIIELITVGLTTIWLAGGALAAFIFALCGVGIVGQLIVFCAVSFVLIWFTRPLVLRYVNPHRTRTNSDGLIGQVVKVTEQIDNRESRGHVIANGLEWTARSQDDETVIPVDALAKVVRIEGVKLIVVPVEH
jgi:membrane protein implicated in regulation of membrane protease activity